MPLQTGSDSESPDAGGSGSSPPSSSSPVPRTYLAASIPPPPSSSRSPLQTNATALDLTSLNNDDGTSNDSTHTINDSVAKCFEVCSYLNYIICVKGMH